MSEISSPPVDVPPPPISDPDEWLSSLAGHVEENRRWYVGLARCWIRRLGVDEIGLAPEGAVHEAWLVFQVGVAAGHIGPPLTREAFARRFPLLIIHAIRDERRRQRAIKRDRSRSVHLSDLEGAGFDAIDPGAPRPEDQVGGREQARCLLGLLAREDEVLRRIALLKLEDFTNREIARELVLPIWAVKRALARIRAILGPHGGERRRSAGVVRLCQPPQRLQILSGPQTQPGRGTPEEDSGVSPEFRANLLRVGPILRFIRVEDPDSRPHTERRAGRCDGRHDGPVEMTEIARIPAPVPN